MRVKSKMKSKFKNIFNKKTTILTIVVVLICLVAPIITHAGVGEWVARAIFGTLGKLVTAIASLFVGLGATFLETMLDVGFSGTYRIIAETGWQVSRDFANMIFILIMVMIAFGTILRIEQYGVKKLLPKLVIVAILINFSLPISYLFIDLSNLTAESFINTSKGNSESIRAKLIDSVRANIMLLPRNCESDYVDSPDEWQRCQNTNETIQKARDDQKWYEIIIAQIIGCIFMLLAAFSLIAGAIMLVIRMLYLAILVMLAPLAFMCYMVPSLSKHWKEWWSSLLKWCFFAPVFMFFFWLATTTVDNITSTLSTSKNALRPAIDGLGFVSGFFANIANMIGYFLFIGLIMGGLIVAQKMGITGASVAMGMAQKAKKGATGWAKRKTFGMAKERGLQGTGLTKQGIGSVLKYFPLFKSTGRRMEAGGKLLKQKSAEGKELEAYKKRLALMSKEDMAKEIKMKHLRPSFRLAAVQKAMERGDLAKTTDRNALKISTKTLKAYGLTKEANDLADSRPDTSDDIKKTVDGVLSKDEQNKWKEATFEPEEGKEIIMAMIGYCGDVKTFIEKFSKMNGLAQKKALDLMKNQIFTDDFGNADNIAVRERHAALTGNVGEAFQDHAGTIPARASASGGAIEKFVQGMQPIDFAKIDPKSAKIIAPHIKAPMAKDILRYISENVRRDFGANFNPAVQAELKAKDNKWRSYIP